MDRDEPEIIDPAAATPEQRRLAEQGLGWGATPDDYPVPSQCMVCAHAVAAEGSDVPLCKAFLGGIPRPFMLNEINHLRPVDYDGGIHFEADPRASTIAVARLRAYFANVDEAKAAEGR